MYLHYLMSFASCVSAVDEFNDILPAVTDAIHSVLEDMTETGFDFSTIKDLGVNEYKKTGRL